MTPRRIIFKMEANTKLTRAKIQLQTEKPFFAYLIMNMRFKETKEVETIGVDKFGNCYYNTKFIDELSEDILKGILAHEVLHVILEHMSRGGEFHKKIYNIATDLCVNDMLETNGFSLDNRGLLTDYNHSFTFELSDGKKIKIENIDKKTSEEVYHEIYNHLKDDDKAIGEQDDKRQDEHIETDQDGDGDGDGKEAEVKAQELKDKWKQAVSEASAYARQKGEMPKGLDLFVEQLLNEKVNWKHLLYKYLTKTIPYDYSYARPSKRSFATGVYMPIMRKEAIEIVVSLDTSASISQSELTEFMTEINGIARSFNNLDMKLIICDSEIKEVYHIANGDSDAISKLKIQGGGGTSHVPVYDYVENELPNTKLLVNFTDGYTDFKDDTHINSLWVICKGGCPEENIPYGEVIKL